MKFFLKVKRHVTKTGVWLSVPCVCCGLPLLADDRLHVRWFTIGSGVSICTTHPNNPPWPRKSWETSGNLILSSLPLVHWHPTERYAWTLNNVQDSLILGIPMSQETITQGLSLDRINGRALYVRVPR